MTWMYLRIDMAGSQVQVKSSSYITVHLLEKKNVHESWAEMEQNEPSRADWSGLQELLVAESS